MHIHHHADSIAAIFRSARYGDTGETKSVIMQLVWLNRATVHPAPSALLQLRALANSRSLTSAVLSG